MFLVLPRSQAAIACKALAKLEGLPRRATIMRNGTPDLALTERLGSALDTTDCVDSGDDDGTTACLDLPTSLEKWLGQTVTIASKQVTLPTADQLAANEGALPAALQAVRQAKRDAASTAKLPG